MFKKEVKTKDGNTKVVIAETKEELDAAVKVAAEDQAPKTVDINVPAK